MERYEREKELEEMEERIFKRVMRQIGIEAKNQATPAVKELQKEIDKLFRR